MSQLANFFEILFNQSLSCFINQNGGFFWKQPVNSHFEDKKINIIKNEIQCDFIFLYKSRCYLFELKEISNSKKINLSYRWQAQLNFLKIMQKNGANAYFLFRFIDMGKIYGISIEKVEEIKDFKYEQIIKIGIYLGRDSEIINLDKIFN